MEQCSTRLGPEHHGRAAGAASSVRPNVRHSAGAVLAVDWLVPVPEAAQRPFPRLPPPGLRLLAPERYRRVVATPACALGGAGIGSSGRSETLRVPEDVA